MPCFLGLAVSVHTPDGPLPEYSIQRQSKHRRITAYIPVPPPTIPKDSTTNRPEQSKFMISITLLTPGQTVPYSTPKPTLENPYPRPKLVSGSPGYIEKASPTSGPAIGPYVPITTNPNETIAAYIYFDGRPKEEVATLLRRGEETWVNSRWVSIPESEGGGLAERDFIFREVGLERWLNGLDLEGKDKDRAVKIERRRQRLERKRREKQERREKIKQEEVDDDGMDTGLGLESFIESRRKALKERNGVLRYGEDSSAPVEALSDDEAMFSSNSDSDDDPPVPEAAGQIKVALFRVLASGEIKRGEYSPQFDVHDDEEGQSQGGENGEADVDHTTSFAKPKALDPKSISTQTVTGIDPSDRPYAVFTFLYRGSRQLQKMGILPSTAPVKTSTTSSKRRSQVDFGELKPLNKATGTKNFAGYRDSHAKSSIPGQKAASDDMESDDDEGDDPAKNQNDDDDDDKKGLQSGLLSPEDAARLDGVSEGVRKIRLKRQHSAEPMPAPQDLTTAVASEPASAPVHPPVDKEKPAAGSPAAGNGALGPTTAATKLADEAATDVAGSPFKRQRASVSDASAAGITGIIEAAKPLSFDKPLGVEPAKSSATDTIQADDEEL